MADPLSIALAAISLATAVKDLVELAQKVEDSFAKVSENFRNAEVLAAEIRQTVDQLKAFCDEHEEILSNANDMKAAVLELIKDMKLVYDQCCEIVPSSSESKIGRLKVTFGAWKKRNKVESHLRELRNRVNKSHTQFMMFSIVRIEKRLVASSSTSISSSTGITSSTSISSSTSTHGSIAIRTEVSKIQVSDESVVSFVGTSSATLSTLPPEISAEFITSAYLRLQIHTINGLMEQLSSTTSYPVEEPLAVYLRPFQPIPGIFFFANDRVILQQDIITQSLQIQTVLRGDPARLSLQAGAWAMMGFSAGLQFLAMYRESAIIGAWTVKLLRTLVTMNSAIYTPYLALSLQNLNHAHTKLGDVASARIAVTELLDIGRRLQASSASLEVNMILAQALRASAHLSTMEGQTTRSLEEAEEAIAIFDTAVRMRTNAIAGPLQVEKATYTSADSVAAAPHGYTQDLLQLSSTWAVYHYTYVLLQLSFSLQGVGRLEDALQAELKAADILRALVALHPLSRVDLELGRSFYKISNGQFRKFLPANDALPMSQQSVAIFRKYYEKDQQTHGTQLCNALQQNAWLLVEMERYDDALQVWQETAALAKKLEEDQLSFAKVLYGLSRNLRLLKRHQEAAEARAELVKLYQSVHNSLEEARSQHDLAEELQLHGSYPEAIREARLAVARYRALAFQDPVKYTKSLAIGLNLLVDILDDADEPEQAVHEGQEALKLFKSLIPEDPSVLPYYVTAIRLNGGIVTDLASEAQSIELGQNIILHSKELVKRFPEKEETTLMYAIYIHSCNLERFDRLEEADVSIQLALNWYANLPADTPARAEKHMDCLTHLADILVGQGNPEKALDPLQKAIDLGMPFSSNLCVASLITTAMRRRSEHLFVMGQYSQALAASKDAVAVARGPTCSGDRDIINSLQSSSMAYHHSGQNDKAICDIQEAIQICRRLIAEEETGVLRSLSTCLRCLSGFRADAGDEVEALSHAQEALDNVAKTNFPIWILPWTNIRLIYVNLSLRLAANNDLPRALEMIAEASADYEQRAQVRIGLFPDLAWILFLQGFLHCAAGQHDKGIVARTKLKDLRQRLDIAFPSVAYLVEVNLDRETKRPSWIALVAKFDLQCSHQDE